MKPVNTDNAADFIRAITDIEGIPFINHMVRAAAKRRSSCEIPYMLDDAERQQLINEGFKVERQSETSRYTIVKW